MASAIGKKRRAAFALLLLLLSYALVEALSYCLFFVLTKHAFSFAEYAAQRDACSNEVFPLPSTDGEERPREVLHPYLGFVANPEASGSPHPVYGTPLAISDFGFPGSESPIHEADDRTVVIAVLGGSFAGGVAAFVRDALAQELGECPRYRGKEFVLVPLALAGYKQPQQWLTLAYFLTLGAHFDIVLNLDGFNEVALPPTENVPKRVFPFYPRRWSTRVYNLADHALVAAMLELRVLTEKRKRWAGFFSRWPFRYSVTMNVLWRARDVRLKRSMNEALLAYQTLERKEGEAPYEATGPSRVYDNNEQMYADLASVWRESSIQLGKLCRANAMDYYHFLQPNQYVRGSKPMGVEELKRAHLEDHPYRQGVEQGYPHLVAEGRSLAAEGIEFHDLTMIFSNVEEPIYVDTCCHVTREGYRMVARRIAEIIVGDVCDDAVASQSE